MDGLFFPVMTGYLIVMMVIGIRDCRKTGEFSEFVVAGKRQGTFTVVMTLLATMLGASTTIGVVDTVDQIGFPGIWWLIMGAVGMILQSVFLSEKVRSIGADTLPHLAEIIVGKPASKLLAGLIAISWIGVIAGQLIAMHGLVSLATGNSSRVMTILISAVVILYTALGGQLSVVKTDRIQLIVILAGLLFCLVALYIMEPDAAGKAAGDLELFNDSYSGMNLLNQFFIIGGVYFLGPDILSRNFLSRDGRTARKAARYAGLFFIGFALVIALIGLWAKEYLSPEEINGQKTLLYIIGILPKGIGLILLLGLFSAILSSTDTCLINAASILTRDLLGIRKVRVLRIVVVLLGGTALAFAVLGSGNIISVLTGAYSIYTPGVIFPLTVAILAYGKRDLRKGIWLSAVIAGGCFGLVGTFLGDQLSEAGLPAWFISNLSLIGMGVSLILSLLSIRRAK